MTRPALQASFLGCEYLVDPLGIDVRTPRLSRQIEVAPRSAGSAGPDGSVASGPPRGRLQSAYRILAAATLAELNAGVVSAWDSGRVAASGSTNAAFAGRALASRERCWWAVRVWAETGH